MARYAENHKKLKRDWKVMKTKKQRNLQKLKANSFFNLCNFNCPHIWVFFFYLKYVIIMHERSE